MKHLKMSSDNVIKALKAVIVLFHEQMKTNHPEVEFEWEGDNASPPFSEKTLSWISKNSIRIHLSVENH